MTPLGYNRPGALYLVGPPGAGKSTIGRIVAARTQSPFHSIDDWVPLVYPPSMRMAPMTDGQVDQAVSLLFRAVRPGCICEFAHHDYAALLAGEHRQLLVGGRIVVCFAELAACKARNGARRSPVPSLYVERSWHSTKDLIQLVHGTTTVRTLILDTTTLPIDDAVAHVATFYSEEGGR
jgi:hypothetical protein